MQRLSRQQHLLLATTTYPHRRFRTPPWGRRGGGYGRRGRRSVAALHGRRFQRRQMQ
jgi:hypothetical protein